MRKGNVKILLLMLFVLAGLAFMFLLTLKSNNMADKSAQALEQDERMRLAQAETGETPMTDEERRQALSERLGEFRRMIANLEQADMPRFKTQTRDAFIELADLIDLYKGEEGTETGAAAPTTRQTERETTRPTTEERNRAAREETTDDNGMEEGDTDQVRESARKIAAAQNEDDLVRELKNGFDSSKESLEQAQEEQNETMAQDETTEDTEQNQQQEEFDQTISQIEDDIEQLDKQNYKTKTKELFTDFHQALTDLNSQQGQQAQQTKQTQQTTTTTTTKR